MKVTIIIGLYNVANHLKNKKLSCILNQTYKNIEIILVNDGSSDDTAKLCNEIKKNNARVRVINKKNGGLGSARNAGLDSATGDYIWFYDVDDEVELNLIEVNVAVINKYNVDMTLFGINVIDMATGYSEHVVHRERLIENNDQFKKAYIELFVDSKHGNGFNWNKFYKRDLIERNKFRFGDNRIQQDEVFNIQLYPLIDRLYVLNLPLYHYYLYRSGTNRCRYISNRFEIYSDVYSRLSKFCDSWLDGDEYYQAKIDQRFYSGLLNTVDYNLLHTDCPFSFKEKVNYVKKILSHGLTRKMLASHNVKRFSILDLLIYRSAEKNYPAIMLVLLGVISIARIIRDKLFVVKSRAR
ncbi:glycosyltransferase family 2 protein [Endozoicomonas acroporae]|uniref:glycosyltransferase family 2 protein n=1 Tax=Endozoicomonas acroporae TaxID=1701104 RepID=UPI003D79CEEA